MIPFQISPPGPVPDFRFLSSASVLAPHYSASVSSFPTSSRLRLTVASSVLPLRFRFLGFLRSFRPGLPCLLSRFFVLGFLSVSFRPSLIRSHSRSSSASLSLSPSGFPLPFRFLSSASLPVLTTQPLFLPFLFFPASPHSCSLRCRPSAFQLPGSSTSVPPGFPCFASISSYSALCSFPFILPGFAPTAA